VVLALGNFPPRAPAEISNIGESGRYIGNPWAPGALRGVDPDVPVIFLGAGLTMADCAVELSALGHRGPMTAWSRGGLLARGRSDSEMAEERVGSMRDTRVASPGFVRVPEMRGTAWLDRARLGAIGAGEEATYRLWKSLPARARRSILKRIAPPVKRVRHRIPPRTYAVLLSLIERGQLRVRAGELAAFTEGALGLEADFRANPSGKRVRIEAALIVNCTGPERDVTRLPDALVRGLVRSGAARPDAVRSGFDCTAGGNVIDRNGERTPGLFAIGPLRSGGPWTADAVPGIRVQAARLGAALRRDGVR
jgi:uncharacterized NAD(P)/FAD-binding protein YdhS